MSSLRISKLRRPALPARHIQRLRLIERLNQGLQSGRQVTLVSAPAGFGKSSCISAWASQLEWPLTWLSLDSADNALGRFLSYLLAALQRIEPQIGQELEAVLRAGQLPPTEVIETRLINDLLLLEQPFVLVLDDLQLIHEQSIFELLEHLLANLPPSLYLVLLTREDPPLPLARLRARNQLSELRAADLRFTHQEAESFLREVLDLTLAHHEITLLTDKTEGWVVGLQLAGLSIRDHRQALEFIAGLSGSHRHILSYLTEEVLHQQPAAIQQFLLQTALLDSLSGDLCNAVTGRSDSHLLLEQLLQANLFLIPLDDERRWYRYHHLFAGVLRELQATRQQPASTILHQRASHWYAQAGLPAEAIHHALAATDYALAVQLIEQHAMDLIMQWYAQTVQDWMQALPPQWSLHSPKANLAFAWMHILSGNFAQAPLYIQRLHTIFAANPPATSDPALAAEWLALQATLCVGQGQTAQGRALASAALELAPEQAGYLRSLIYLSLAAAYEQLHDWSQAVQAYQQIIQHGRAAANLASELLGISGLALMHLHQGRLHAALECATRGIERIERSSSLPPISAAVYGELGQVYYQWYQLEQARHYFERSAQLSRLSGYSDAEIYYAVVRSRLCQAQNDLPGATRELQAALDLAQRRPPVAVREELIAQQVSLALAQNHPQQAQILLAQSGIALPEPPDQHGLNHALALLLLSRLRLLLHQHEWPAALELATRLIAAALQSQFLPTTIEALLLRAQLLATQNHLAASQADYLQALKLGQPEGLISLFIEQGQPVFQALSMLRQRQLLDQALTSYVNQILVAFEHSLPGANQPAGPAPAALGEPLTARELDVLRLIGAGLTYEEIGQQLMISVNTVRSHIKTLYGKLAVNNRTRALEQARQLGLL